MFLLDLQDLAGSGVHIHLDQPAVAGDQFDLIDADSIGIFKLDLDHGAGMVGVQLPQDLRQGQDFPAFDGLLGQFEIGQGVWLPPYGRGDNQGKDDGKQVFLAAQITAAVLTNR